MRVMFVNQSLQIGGAERQIFNLAKGFADMKDMEISILVLKKEGAFAKELSTKIKDRIRYSSVYLTTMWPLRPVLRTVSVMLEAKRFRPDVIYARVMPLHCAIAGKLLKIPVVMGEINNPSKKMAKNRPAPLRLQTFLVRKASRKLATHIVANSLGLAKEAKKYWKLPSLPTVIYNGLDTEDIHEKSKENVTFPWPDHEKTPLIVSTGRLTPAKGFSCLIEAFAAVKKTMQARLLIIGNRSKEGEKERLLEKVRAMNLEACVSFTGEQPNPYPFMKAADVYVCSSLYEGFSNSLLEALALGLPVVSTDHDFGAGEMIENNKSGLLVPVSQPEVMADAVLRILKNRELAQSLSLNARQRASEFTIEKTASKYEKLFQEVIKASQINQR